MVGIARGSGQDCSRVAGHHSCHLADLRPLPRQQFVLAVLLWSLMRLKVSHRRAFGSRPLCPSGSGLGAGVPLHELLHSLCRPAAGPHFAFLCTPEGALCGGPMNGCPSRRRRALRSRSNAAFRLSIMHPRCCGRGCAPAAQASGFPHAEPISELHASLHTVVSNGLKAAGSAQMPIVSHRAWASRLPPRRCWRLIAYARPMKPMKSDPSTLSRSSGISEPRGRWCVSPGERPGERTCRTGRLSSRCLRG